MKYHTVGELINKLKEYPEDTKIVIADYYYEVHEGWVICIDDRCIVESEGVLYIDTNGVNVNPKTGIPWVTIY